MSELNISESFAFPEAVRSREYQLSNHAGGAGDSENASTVGETAPLTKRDRSGAGSRGNGSKYRVKTRCCVRSNAALLILVWSSLVPLSFTDFLNQNLYLSLGTKLITDGSVTLSIQVIPPVVYSLFAILYLFYPLAGCLADIGCGRYKTVVRSLWFVSGSGLVLLTSVLVITYATSIGSHHVKFILVVTFGLLAIFGLVMLCSSYVTFDANVIQFGMDQLYDSPSEDSVLFVHWFVFASSLGPAITRIPSSWITTKCWQSFLVFGLFALTMTIILSVSLCFARRKRHWFMIDQASRNPYKLVYRVIKFAAQHKTPIRRSAFTYCEDELPSRMDLGKDKYGGPFTTEQVEDVKAFLGILCILITIGPVFTVDTTVNRLLQTVPHHFTINDSCTATNYFIEAFNLGRLSLILIVLLIPIFICLLRPLIQRCLPGMLKRLGIGMALILLSLICTLIIDTIGHARHSHKVCFRNIDTHTERANHVIDSESATYTISYVLNGFGYLFIYIASYEFICAQSPHAMKGLLIGTFYAIKGVFQLIGAIVIFVPFYMYRLKTHLPSCGFVYYLINILVALSGLVAYTCVARRYQYRQRDEPDNVYRYAEEYYDKSSDYGF